MRIFDALAGEVNLRCVDFGGRGETCLLLHGLGDGWFVWEEFAEQLAPHYHVVALDLRGHGDSTWGSDGDYGFDAFVPDILALCDRLKLRHIALVGHSLGAGIAMRVACRRPELVRKLVLVDFGPLVDTPDERVASAMCERFGRANRPYASTREYAQMLREIHPFLYDSLLDRIAHQSLRAQTDGASMVLKRDPALVNFFAARRHADDHPSFWYLLAQIMCPTLVVRGEVSGLLPAVVAGQMVSTLPQGRYMEVPFAAHSIMLDNPEGLADAVLTFLASITTRKVRVRVSGRRTKQALLTASPHWPPVPENARAAHSHPKNPR